MVDMGPATEDEVVLAFLKAEIDSPTWGPHYQQVLSARLSGRGHALPSWCEERDFPTERVAILQVLALLAWRHSECSLSSSPTMAWYRRLTQQD
jgi:hypothetical protein